MTTLELFVVKDVSLGKDVFRGSAAAKEIVPASWIVFCDLDRNPLGYQRPINNTRSQKAAEYAETNPEGFWPECILAIRSNNEADEEKDKVQWEFKEINGTEGRFGKLIITYNETNVENIAGEQLPWRRAFSQVDCQHRLGFMSTSDQRITFCIFPDMTRNEEAVIFKTINATQKGASTSLVDLIIWATDPNAPVQLKWAYDLGQDPGSAFNRRVNTGGRNVEPPVRLVTLRTLHHSVRLIMRRRTLGAEANSLAMFSCATTGMS